MPSMSPEDAARFETELEFVQCLANAQYLHCDRPPTSPSPQMYYISSQIIIIKEMMRLLHML